MALRRDAIAILSATKKSSFNAGFVSGLPNSQSTVKGFEKSQMREILVKALTDNNFVYQEFILSPTQLGIPNTRHRYYCIAKKLPDDFCFQRGQLMERFPLETDEPLESFSIFEIIEPDVLDKYYLSEKVLNKRFQVLDIICKDSQRSCCFTKAYGRFLEGTGSVFTSRTETELSEVYSKLKNTEKNSEVYFKLVKSLNLRFLTPKEIARLMCFKESYSFPSNVSDRQRYMVLGNSINIKVVAELIKLLK